MGGVGVERVNSEIIGGEVFGGVLDELLGGIPEKNITLGLPLAAAGTGTHE